MFLQTQWGRYLYALNIIGAFKICDEKLGSQLPLLTAFFELYHQAASEDEGWSQLQQPWSGDTGHVESFFL